MGIFVWILKDMIFKQLWNFNISETWDLMCFENFSLVIYWTWWQCFFFLSYKNIMISVFFQSAMAAKLLCNFDCTVQRKNTFGEILEMFSFLHHRSKRILIQNENVDIVQFKMKIWISSAGIPLWLQISWHLTHWGRDNMTTISQTTLSNVFSWMKI